MNKYLILSTLLLGSSGAIKAMQKAKDLMYSTLRSCEIVLGKDLINDFFEIRDAVETSNLSKLKAIVGNPIYESLDYYHRQMALSEAIEQNKHEIVTWLLSVGANPNDLCLTKSTGLHILVGRNYIEMANLLLKNRCNINGKNNGGDTPLHLASFHGDHTLVEFLLINGANINIKDRDGKTALDLAKQREHKKVIALFDQR